MDEVFIQICNMHVSCELEPLRGPDAGANILPAQGPANSKNRRVFSRLTSIFLTFMDQFEPKTTLSDGLVAQAAVRRRSIVLCDSQILGSWNPHLPR